MLRTKIKLRFDEASGLWDWSVKVRGIVFYREVAWGCLATLDQAIEGINIAVKLEQRTP